MLTTSTVDVLSWAADHLALIGWPVVIGLIWKFRGAIDDYVSSWKAASNRIAATETIAVAIKTDVDTMMTNHLKHIEDALASEKEVHAEELKTLQSMDKNIAVLVDRRL
jgi:hypothetical protein